jgi:flagellar biosynthetic protein FliR
MTELSQLVAHRWPEVVTFLLILGRAGGLIISAPFWGGASVPRLVRAMTVVCLSVALYPLVGTTPLPPGQREPALVALLTALGGEVLLGLVLGWAAQLLFAGMHLAGQMMETKMGLSLTQLVDPQNGGHTTLLPALLDLITALVFFSLNGHHLLIRALASSYTLFPLAGERPALSGVGGPDLARLLVASAEGVFTIALRVSAPVLVGLLFADILLGIISRAIPQMNVFSVALPVQLAFGVFLLLLSLPVLVWFCTHQLSALSSQLSAVLISSGGK